MIVEIILIFSRFFDAEIKVEYGGKYLYHGFKILE